MADDKKPDPKPEPTKRKFDPTRYVEVGDHVHWFPGADVGEEPHHAVVTKKGIATVDLALLQERMHNFAILDGVPNVGDRAADEVRARSGGWAHTPLTIVSRHQLVDDGLYEFDGKRLAISEKFQALLPEPEPVGGPMQHAKVPRKLANAAAAAALG